MRATSPYIRFLIGVATLAAGGALTVAAHANPAGGHVVGGAATIQGQETPGVIVNQLSQSAIIDWQSFNIAPGETTKFIQPNAAAVALNRVTGDKSPSSIFGSLSANGRIFLVNPEGFIFGPSAKINTAAFLATTHDITNDDFLAGRYKFGIPGNPKASIVNEGTITIADTGIAALVAPAVRNDGVITARLGKVALASANGFTLDLYGDNLITFSLNDAIASQVIDVATGKPIKSLVKNRGKLSAEGGTVAMTAVTARALVDSVINNSGVVEAQSVGVQNGRIVLGAQTAKSKHSPARTQKVLVSGTLDVSGKSKGETGGTVQVTGESIALNGASIDAGGDAGGGKVLIGGDTGGGIPNPAVAGNTTAALEPQQIPTASAVAIDASSTIDVSAVGAGNGGKVVVWSDDDTVFNGAAISRGGTLFGNGGFVETSSHDKLGFSGQVDLDAPNGERGTLLLDPKDVTIGSSGAWVVTPAAIEAALATSDVIVNTSAAGTDAGDITVAESVSWNNANTLTLSANRNITVLNGVTISNTSTGNLVMRADDTGSGTGSISFQGTGKVDYSDSMGIVSVFYNPAGGYSSPTDYTPYIVINGAVSGQLTAYMLVNDVNDLQDIQQNLSGNYALGKDIDASATATWNGGIGFLPIGNGTSTFLGTLFGQGYTIDQLTINSSGSYIGLFGVLGPTSKVVQVGLLDVDVIANTASTVTSSLPYVGSLAGSINKGTIIDSYATGNVGSSVGGTVGGLVAVNGGMIVDSYSGVNVSNQSLFGGATGGLVGQNAFNGVIKRSYATGNVLGNTANGTGGLVGLNNSTNGGAIDQTFATGLVSGNGTGGLVGSGSACYSSSPGCSPVGPITNSYWDIQSTGQATSIGSVYANSVGANYAGLSTVQLKSGLPQGFSSAAWGINGTTNAGYPFLLWQAAAAAPATILSGAAGTPVTLYYVASSQSVQYGQDLPSLTGTVIGFLPGDSLATATTGTLTFTTPATSSSSVGNYAITGSGLTPTGNYVFAQDPGNATALAIMPAPLTISADNLQKTYGATLNFTGQEFTTIGLVNGDSVSSVSLSSAGALPTATVAGGPYQIDASNAIGSGLGNYAITYAPGSLVVNPAPLTITADNQSKQFGAPFTFSGQEFSASGLVNGDTVSSVSLSSPGAPANATVTGSPYAITASNAQGSGLGNYSISYVDGAFSVISSAPPPPTPAILFPVVQDPAAQAQILSLIYPPYSTGAASTPSVAPIDFLFTGAQQSYLDKRNSIALAYAFDNEVVQSEISDLLTKAYAAYGFGPVAPTAEVVANFLLKFKAAWKINAEGHNGNYLRALNDGVGLFSEVFLETVAALSASEGGPVVSATVVSFVDNGLGVTKLAAAFATAYTYGFVWGQ